MAWRHKKLNHQKANREINLHVNLTKDSVSRVSSQRQLHSMESHAEGRTAKAKPPEILSNKFWPVRQNILSCLSYHDKRALAEAYPELKIQEDAKYKRQEMLHQVEILSELDCHCHCSAPHSHFGHPLSRAIIEKSRIRALDQDRHTRSTGRELANKTQEINHYISNISEDINKISPVATELCLSVKPKCRIGGYTALHVAAFCNDAETARMLIKEGADMYRKAGFSFYHYPGFYPWFLQGNCLHTAVLSESLDVARVLVTEGNMDTGFDGVTALDLAERIALFNGETETMGQIIQLLQS